MNRYGSLTKGGVASDNVAARGGGNHTRAEASIRKAEDHFGANVHWSHQVNVNVPSGRIVNGSQT